jgi:hypothetical protein
MLECAHCGEKVEYDDAKSCPECEGPLCKADCADKGTCMDYLKKNGRASDSPDRGNC